MTGAGAGRAGASDPRVESVTARAFTIPTDMPEADGTIAWDSTTLVLVEAAGAGVSGLGWTYGAAPTASVVEGLLRGAVVGTSVFDVAGTNQAMQRAVRNAGRPGLVSLAISAVDVALWDLKARLLNLPLHRLLGAQRDRVPLYGSGGFTTYDAPRLELQVEQWLDAGMTQVKIKIGQDWGNRVDRDIDRIRQTRRLIGESRGLFIDANGGYTRKQAIRLMRDVADANVTWYEEPVSSDDLAGLREVRDAVDADIAAGEYGYDLGYFRRMCQAEAVDCLQADASRCGGITEWLRVAATAASFNLDISGHCAPQLHAAVAAAVPNLRHLEWFHDHVRIESMAFEGAAPASDGSLPLTDEPGLGLRWRESDMEQYRVT